jgi:fucose permease
MAGGGVAFFVSTFASGHLVHAVGPKKALLLGLALVLVGVAFFGAVPDPVTNLLLNILVGLGQGALEVTVNSAAVRLDSRRTGAPMTLMQGAFAVGAIAGPLALGALVQAGWSWTLVYRAMAAVFGLLLVALLTQRFDLPAAPAEAAGGRKRSSHPVTWLGFAVLFLYVGVELGVSSWVAEYFIRTLHFDTVSAALLVSLFWAGILLGRFGVPWLAARAHPDRQLVVFTTVATGFVVLLALLGSAGGQVWAPALGVAAVFGAGLGCSVIYGLVITLVGLTFPHAQSQAIGFAATGGGIGAFLFPFFGSVLAQAWGLQSGFAAFAGFAVLMAVGSAVLVKKARPDHS